MGHMCRAGQTSLLYSFVCSSFKRRLVHRVTIGIRETKGENAAVLPTALGERRQAIATANLEKGLHVWQKEIPQSIGRH